MKQITMPNQPVHVTAARLRFWMNVKGYGGAAARDGERWMTETTVYPTE